MVPLLCAKMAVKLYPTIFAVLLLSRTAFSATCPPTSGMTQQSGPPSGKWYLLLPGAVTFAGAAPACSALGLQLARVATAADYGNVVGYLEGATLILIN